MMKVPLIKLLKKVFKKVRPYIAFVAVVCISLSPLISNNTYKVIALSVLASLLLYILLDLFSEIEKRFDTINSKLGVKEPPTFDSFPDVLPDIKQVVKDRWLKNQDVTLSIIAVSAQFSWKNIAEVLVPELLSIKASKAKLTIVFVMVDPEILRLWGQKRLSKYCQNIIEMKEIVLSLEEYKNAVNDNRLQIDMHVIDNMPHWHGVLIDKEVLYLGRCSWDFRNSHIELRVGRREYRKFKNDDRFQGKNRIDLFQNWFEAYKIRSKYNPYNSLNLSDTQDRLSKTTTSVGVHTNSQNENT